MSNIMHQSRRRRTSVNREIVSVKNSESAALVGVLMDEETEEFKRAPKIPKDAGLLLTTAGILGLVVPGVVGMPFLILGGLILLPQSRARAEGWLSGKAPKSFSGSIRQINRFLLDLERRYPDGGKRL
ncbi:MAG: hypothetical protein ACK443_01880 [Methylococcaceae bacterium]|jgi:hypothetical protein